MKQYEILVLPGDGIGPEVVTEAVKVLEKVGRRLGYHFRLNYDDIGGVAIDKYGVPLRPSTLAAAGNVDAILFGAVGGPKWDNPDAKVRPEDGILSLRKELGLFANIRPVKASPYLVNSSVLKPHVLRDVDILIIRELTGGLYFAKPKRRYKTRRGWVGVDTLRYHQEEIERVLRVGFELACTRRKKLTSVDKANVLESSRLWRQICVDIAGEYPDVEVDHLLVDNCAMQLVQVPARFDVIVAENMFGDILTDEGAVLAASMGMLPSASLADVPREGQKALGLYEPIHGTAPDIEGQGIANPIATILSMALMMRYSLGLTEEASIVERAVDEVLQKGYRTKDIATNADKVVTTAVIGDAVSESI